MSGNDIARLAMGIVGVPFFAYVGHHAYVKGEEIRDENRPHEGEGPREVPLAAEISALQSAVKEYRAKQADLNKLYLDIQATRQLGGIAFLYGEFLTQSRSEFAKYVQPGVVPEAVELLKMLEKARDEVQVQIPEVIRAKQKIEEQRGVVAKNRHEEYKKRSKDVDAISKQIIDLQHAFDALLKENVKAVEVIDKEIRDLMENIRTERANDDEERRKFAGEEQALQARLTEINARMRQKDIIKGPDGQVLEANNEQAYAVINIGKVDGVKKGFHFDIYRMTKGGVQAPKGKCRVVEVDEHYSQVILRNHDPAKDPVLKGDFVDNLLFGPPKNYTYAFVGTFEESLSPYNQEKLEALVRFHGNTVHRRLNKETDILVVGKGVAVDHETIKQGREWGTAMLSGKLLLQQIGHDYDDFRKEIDRLPGAVNVRGSHGAPAATPTGPGEKAGP